MSEPLGRAEILPPEDDEPDEDFTEEMEEDRRAAKAVSTPTRPGLFTR